MTVNKITWGRIQITWRQSRNYVPGSLDETKLPRDGDIGDECDHVTTIKYHVMKISRDVGSEDLVIMVWRPRDMTVSVIVVLVAAIYMMQPTNAW